jgi:hypothetical protein
MDFHCDEHFVVAHPEILDRELACLRLTSRRVAGDIGCIASLWELLSDGNKSEIAVS